MTETSKFALIYLQFNAKYENILALQQRSCSQGSEGTISRLTFWSRLATTGVQMWTLIADARARDSSVRVHGRTDVIHLWKNTRLEANKRQIRGGQIESLTCLILILSTCV